MKQPGRHSRAELSVSRSTPMDLKAISVGPAVPQTDFNSVVHSVFREAANLRSGKEGRLLTLITAESGDLPQGIRVDLPGDFSFENFLKPGKMLICRSGILKDEQEHLAVDLHRARRWRCQLPELDKDEIEGPAAAAWASVWQALIERQRRTGTVIQAAELCQTSVAGRTALAEKTAALVRELVDAARKLDPSAKIAVKELIGLGTGLTPTGDDFLVGFLTGLSCVKGKEESRLNFLSDLGRAVIRLSRRTNDISRTYLYHAVHGRVSSALARLAEAILEGQAGRPLLHSVEGVMKIGHASGMDMVTGLLAGLCTWQPGLVAIQIKDQSDINP